MQNIKYTILDASKTTLMCTIADWYYQEWHIPPEKTIELLKNITSDISQYYVVLEIDSEPVATAGLHKKVGIMDIDPDLKQFKNWLALVYTAPKYRKKGYASLLCMHIEEMAKLTGIEKLHLFTHTAESLYSSLNWIPIKRIKHGDKNIVIMEKQTLSLLSAVPSRS